MSRSEARSSARVAFHVYIWPEKPLQVAAECVRSATGLPLAPGWGRCRGTFHRWSGDDGADLLLQANVTDEAGAPVEPGVGAGVPVLYATGLAAPVLAALAALEGAVLVSADVVEVPPANAPPPVVVPV